MAFGFAAPSAGPMPAPADVQGSYRERSPDPSKYIFKNMFFPDKLYSINFASFDVLGPMTGRLQAGDMDSSPVAQAGRHRKNVAIEPIFMHASRLVRPSEVVNQRKLGTLTQMAAAETIMLAAEEVATMIDQEQELMCIAAATGSVLTTYAGSTLTYTYTGLQTFTPSVLWDHKDGSGNYDANVIDDLCAMVAKLVPECLSDSFTLIIPDAVARILGQNAGIRDLAKQSVYMGQIGPGAAGKNVTNEMVGTLLQGYTGIRTVIKYSETRKTATVSGGVPTYTVHSLMPSNTISLIGAPAYNQPLGAFAMCPTINQGNWDNPSPGPWIKAFDHTQTVSNGAYEIYGGFNGVPEIHIPSCMLYSVVTS